MNKIPPKSLDIHCPHFVKCAGCTIATAVDNPIVVEEMNGFFAAKGIDFKLHAESATAWRFRAKLAVRGSYQDPLIGLYEKGSHQVVGIPHCQVHHPLINMAVERIRSWIMQNKISLYREQDGVGELRYLQVIVERSSGRVQIAFVLNISPQDEPSVARWRKNLQILWQKHETAWHSFSINYNTRRDNVIFSRIWEHCFAEPYLWEKFLGVDVCFLPECFAQANLPQFESLLKKIAEWIPEEARIAEFYAGVGAIGLTLSSGRRQILCCEINSSAQACFEKSKGRLGKESHNISWHQGNAEAFADWLAKADTIIVDPPRKGLDAGLIGALNQANQPLRLIYMSCGWPAFKRDAEALLSQGWSLQKAAGYLFFPGTNHVETLALLEKK